jgi:hypothetical protein
MESARKFSENPNSLCFSNLQKHILESESNLIAAAFSKNSWACMSTASNRYNEFLAVFAMNHDFTQQKISKFINWCYYEKKLKHSSINSYISSLATICKLMGEDDNAFCSYKTKCLLRGVKNLDCINCYPTNRRNVITFPILKLLGHQIASSTWPISSKRIVWTTCTVLFWGSLRVGEILSINEGNFDPLTTLLWEDVSFINNSVRISIRFPKIFSPGGVTVDLFPVTDDSLCPVSSFRNLLASLDYTPHPIHQYSCSPMENFSLPAN